jgi:hypothetical protein
MTYDQFLASLEAPAPPSLPELPLALWHDAKGDWQAAHEIAQSREGTRDYDRLHAYLHRVEGDTWNAGYWYRRAGTSLPDKPLREEWEELVRAWL